MAKKAESTLKNMFLSLTVIALVAAAALAAMNAITEGPIRQAEQNKVNAAIKAVLCQTDQEGNVTAKIEYDESRMVDTVIRFKTDARDDSVVCHLAYSTEGEYRGAAVEAIDFNGFGGNLRVMVGFDVDGNVYGYSILESNETPGLGAKADKWFQPGKKGCIVGRTPDSTLYVTKDKDHKGNVDAITGSTITSKAFMRCVHKAYENLMTVVAAPVEEQPAECCAGEETKGCCEAQKNTENNN